MATIHITRAEAVRDIAVLLEKAATGTEIIIESDQAPPVILRAEETGTEAGHEDWVRERVQAALDDSSPRISHTEVKTRIEKKLAAAREGNPGIRA